ncbi:MAG TPA: helix-turn-helix domain-containing protein [Dehalococcoidia bacterium]|jgi:DNA-binding HxlR family transcriptional regulator|nr:helix-turn-helix domain-containing protein [Dehalococcoidia bacterium]
MKSYGQNCPVAKSLDILGDRWTLLIIRELFFGRTRFAEFQARLPGIPTNLLGDRLKQLEESGIVARRFYCQHPPRAEYVLTEKGKALDRTLGALAEWGDRFANENESDASSAYRRLHSTCGQPLRLRWYCAECDEPAGRNVIITAPDAPASVA